MYVSCTVYSVHFDPILSYPILTLPVLCCVVVFQEIRGKGEKPGRRACVRELGGFKYGVEGREGREGGRGPFVIDGQTDGGVVFMVEERW